MRCPLCKEEVQDKETLQVHYVTSCTGYQQQAGGAGRGDGRGSRTVVMGPRKASVTFQWMKSRPTMDQEVFLFSTFDQVALPWDAGNEIFRSVRTEVACGTYSDCQLVVGGELYATKPVVINQDSPVIHIQLANDRAIEEIHPHGDDWRQSLAAQDRKAKDSPVDRSHQDRRLKESSIDTPRTYGCHPTDRTSGDAARSDVQKPWGIQQQLSQGTQVSDIRAHGRRSDGVSTARDYNSPLAPVQQPHASRTVMAGSERRPVHEADMRASTWLPDSGRALSGTVEEYRRNSQDIDMKNQRILAVGDPSNQRPSTLPSEHDVRVDRMKEMSSLYPTPVHGRQPNNGYLDQQQGSEMDAHIQGTMFQSESKRPVGGFAHQQNPVHTDPSNYHPTHQRFEALQEDLSRQSGHGLPQLDTTFATIRKLQAERDQFARELIRSEGSLKNLTAQLEQYQVHEKELQHSVTQLKQLLGEKDASEEKLHRRMLYLDEQNQGLQEEAREVHKQNRELQQAVAVAETQLKQVAVEREKSSKAQVKLESANKYNSHLEGELKDCQKALLQEKSATAEISKVAGQMQDRVRYLEEESRRLQQRASECDDVMIAMESMRSNLDGLQLTNFTLKEQLDQLEADRAIVVKEKLRAEQELTKARKYKEECSSLEKDIKQRDKEFDAIQRENLTLRNQLTSVTAQKEEAEGVIESLQNYEAEIANLKASLKKQQAELQQLADEKGELTARIQTEQSDRTKLNRALMEERDKVTVHQIHVAAAQANKNHEEVIGKLYEEQTKVKDLEDRLMSMEQQLKIEGEKVLKAEEAVQRAKVHNEDKKKSIAHLKDDMGMLRDELKREQSEKSALQQQLGAVKVQLEQLQQSAEDCVKSRQQIQQLQKTIKVVEESKKAETCCVERLEAALKGEREHREQIGHKLKKQVDKTTSREKQIEELQSQLNAKCQALQAGNEMLQRKEDELRLVTSKLNLSRESQSQQEELKMKLQEKESLVQSLQSDLKQGQAAYGEAHDSIKRYRTQRNQAREECNQVREECNQAREECKQRKRSPSPHLSRKNDKEAGPSVRRGTNTVSADRVDRESRDPQALLLVHSQQTERSRVAALVQRVASDNGDQSVQSPTDQHNTTFSLPAGRKPNSLSQDRSVAAVFQGDRVPSSGSAVAGHGAVDKHVGPVSNSGHDDGSYSHSQSKPKQGQWVPVKQGLGTEV